MADIRSSMPLQSMSEATFEIMSTFTDGNNARYKEEKLIHHVHADYAPPRSWEQFEELCADVFQSAWQDPALVRHGRAGQRQNGVTAAVQALKDAGGFRAHGQASLESSRGVNSDVLARPRTVNALRSLSIL